MQKSESEYFKNQVLIIDIISPLTLSPRSFCLSGRTPVKVLMDCFRSNTVSSSDRELMKYSWPPHLMITDTDMTLRCSSHTHTHDCSWSQVCTRTLCKKFPATITNMHAHTLQKGRDGQIQRKGVRMPPCNWLELDLKQTRAACDKTESQTGHYYC